MVQSNQYDLTEQKETRLFESVTHNGPFSLPPSLCDGSVVFSLVVSLSETKFPAVGLYNSMVCVLL